MFDDEGLQQACPGISEDFLVRQKFRQIQMMVEIDTDSSNADGPRLVKRFSQASRSMRHGRKAGFARQTDPAQLPLTWVRVPG